MPAKRLQIEDIPLDTTVVKKRKGTPRKPPAAGKGRPKGVPNKVTKCLKDAILGALELAGGPKSVKAGANGTETFLLAQARKKNNTGFMILVGKVLPSTMAITGPEGKDLKITFEIIRPQVINPKSSQNAPDSQGNTQKVIGG